MYGLLPPPTSKPVFKFRVHLDLAGSRRDSVWERQRAQRLAGCLTLKEELRLHFVEGQRVELVKGC